MQAVHCEGAAATTKRAAAKGTAAAGALSGHEAVSHSTVTARQASAYTNVRLATALSPSTAESRCNCSSNLLRYHSG